MQTDLQFLLQLIDDPCEEISDMVTTQLINIGSSAIPILQCKMDETTDIFITKRLDNIIAQIYAQETNSKLKVWIKDDSNYLNFLLIIHQLCPLENELSAVESFIKNIRKKIWLESNQYLTTLEQVNIITNIISKQFSIKDIVLNNIKPTYHHLFIGSIINANSGHNYLIAALYKAITQLFELNTTLILVNNTQIMCAIYNNYGYTNEILCIINPSCSSVYSLDEIKEYEFVEIDKVGFSNIYFTELNSLSRKYNQTLLTVYTEEVLKFINSI